MTKTHVRWMIRRDMPEVQAIEEGCFFPYSWTEEDFLRCLRERNCIGMVVEETSDENFGRVLGFMIYELHKTHLALINFGVRPDHQRQSLGSQMLQTLQSKLTSHRRTRLLVEVRESNLAAQLFFRSQGFQATSVQRASFEDTGEDGYSLEYEVPHEHAIDCS